MRVERGVKSLALPPVGQLLYVSYRPDDAPEAWYHLIAMRLHEMREIRRQEPQAVGFPSYFALAEDGTLQLFPETGASGELRISFYPPMITV